MEDAEHPARPEQPEHGFEEGLETGPDPEEEIEGRFSTGQEDDVVTPDERRESDFARGQEVFPEDETERRYSQGQE